MRYNCTANYLRMIRQANGLTQAQLAESLGLKAQSISNIERGLTRVPRKYIFKICKILNVRPSSLVDQMIGDLKDHYLNK